MANVAFDFDLTLMLPKEGGTKVLGNPNIEFVNKAKEHIKNKDTVYIVTSRNFTDESLNQIFKFLQKNHIMIPPSRIYHTNGHPKGNFIIQNGLNICLLYDDDPDEIKNVEKYNIKGINAFNDEAKNAFEDYYDLKEENKMKDGIKVYLDDVRPEPKGWVRAYWPEEVIKLLKTGNVDEISLDHDLGNDEHGTGYDVILWIEEQVALHGFNPPKINVHSANSSAREKMERGIEAIKKLHKKENTFREFFEKETEKQILL